MAEWWQSLTVTQNAFFIVGCATLVFLVMQILMLTFGKGQDESIFSEDINNVVSDEKIAETKIISERSAFCKSVFTLKSLITFFVITAWMDFSLEFVLPFWGSVLLAIVAGVAVVLGIGFVDVMTKNKEIQNDKTQDK